MTEGGARGGVQIFGKQSTAPAETVKEIKNISIDSDPLNMLIHANQQLNKFLDSMKKPVNETSTPDFNKFNLQPDIEISSITSRLKFNNGAEAGSESESESDSNINILNKAYSDKLKAYLIKKDNILTQYKELLLKLIPDPNTK